MIVRTVISHTLKWNSRQSQGRAIQVVFFHPFKWPLFTLRVVDSLRCNHSSQVQWTLLWFLAFMSWGLHLYISGIHLSNFYKLTYNFNIHNWWFTFTANKHSIRLPCGPLSTWLSKKHGLLWSVCAYMFKHCNCLSMDSKAEEIITFWVCACASVCEVSVDTADRWVTGCRRRLQMVRGVTHCEWEHLMKMRVICGKYTEVACSQNVKLASWHLCNNR